MPTPSPWPFRSLALLTVALALALPAAAVAQPGSGDPTEQPFEWTLTVEPTGVQPGESATLVLQVTIPDGLHTYPLAEQEFASPSQFELTLPGGVTATGEWVEPETHRDSMDIAVVSGTAQWRRELQVAADAATGDHEISVTSRCFVCTDNFCSPDPKVDTTTGTLRVLADGETAPVAAPDGDTDGDGDADNDNPGAVGPRGPRRPGAGPRRPGGPRLPGRPGGPGINLPGAGNQDHRARHDEVTVSLVVDAASLKPGSTVMAGVRFDMAEHWHIYWHNAGGPGFGPSYSWTLPEGITAGPIQWPYPHRLRTGSITNYGYEGDMILPVELTITESVQPGDALLELTVGYQICKTACLVYDDTLKLTLPVSADEPGSASEAIAGLFDAARKDLPINAAAAGWTVRAAVGTRDVVIQVDAPDGAQVNATRVLFFPDGVGLIDVDAGSHALATTESGWQITVPRAAKTSSYGYEPDEAWQTVTGMLVIVEGNGWDAAGHKALAINAPVTERTALVATTGTISGGAADGLTVPLALLFAFLGGMILNLMPCVLPVLSIKVLGFVDAAQNTHVSPFTHAAVFSAGVIGSFLALGGLLVGLQAAGSEIGWGFQLQEPGFLIFLIFFMFLFGLNLFGVFEVGTSLTGVGAGKKRDGLIGSFVAGVTATLVATPCTAPFMGAALGFALSLPSWQALMIFASLGVGMALPYVVLGSNPRLLKMVPKPGPWMVTLKQFMGFLLMATVAWLVWVYATVTGIHMVVWIGLSLTFVAMAGWIYGKWGHVMKAKPTRIKAAVGVLLVSALALWAIIPSGDEALEWETYTPTRLADLRESGRPVLVDFTADWCVSCKANEAASLNQTRTAEYFEKWQIHALKADWTKRDDDIARILKRHGRQSVPLVLYFPPGASEPVVFPEVLLGGPDDILGPIEEANQAAGYTEPLPPMEGEDEGEGTETAAGAEPHASLLDWQPLGEHSK